MNVYFNRKGLSITARGTQDCVTVPFTHKILLECAGSFEITVMVLFCLPTFPALLKITFMVVLPPAATTLSLGLTAVQPQLA